MKMYGEWRYSSKHSEPQHYVGGNWSASYAGRFILDKTNPVLNGFQVGLNMEPAGRTMKREKPGIEPRFFCPEG
jgi:hypothetical protein